MDSRERALKRIDQVLELEVSPDVAYPIRARLGRAMHEVVRWAATDPGNELDHEWLLATRARAERIVQPSEPFDTVWQAEWAAAIQDLRMIRIALTT